MGLLFLEDSGAVKTLEHPSLAEGGDMWQAQILKERSGRKAVALDGKDENGVGSWSCCERPKVRLK